MKNNYLIKIICILTAMLMMMPSMPRSFANAETREYSADAVYTNLEIRSINKHTVLQAMYENNNKLYAVFSVHHEKDITSVTYTDSNEVSASVTGSAIKGLNVSSITVGDKTLSVSNDKHYLVLVDLGTLKFDSGFSIQINISNGKGHELGDIGSDKVEIDSDEDLDDGGKEESDGDVSEGDESENNGELEDDEEIYSNDEDNDEEDNDNEEVIEDNDDISEETIVGSSDKGNEDEVADESDEEIISGNSGENSDIEETTITDSKNENEDEDIADQNNSEIIADNGADDDNSNGRGSSNTIIEELAIPLANLEKSDHFAYAVGYPEGDVKPLKNITREEVAMIFYRLLTDESRNAFLSDENTFTDLGNHEWSRRAISTLSSAGILKGYPDGSFRPSSPITRAEFATVAAKFDNLDLSSESKFTDIKSHWAEKFITSSEIKGWISGYPGSTFKPEQDITRAEAMTLINNVLGRKVPQENIHPEAMYWQDISNDDWYYEAVMEATNSHDYTQEEDGDELWTVMKVNKIWP